MTTDDRVLVLMPTAKDGERTRLALAAAGLTSVLCKDLAELCQEIEQGAGVALLTEELVVSDQDGCLHRVLREQPPWSDMPLVVLAREGGGERRHVIRESMNATLVERPVKLRSLLSVLRAALRSRNHQYSIRDHLAERKRVELELAETQARLEATLAAGEVATWTWDIQADKVFADKNLAALYSISTEEARGGPIDVYLQRVAADDRERVARLITEAVAARRAYEAEYRIVRPDGQSRTLIARGRAEYDAEGRPVRMPGVVVDITERERAKEEVVRLAAESERQRRVYETALSNTVDFNYVFDLQGRFVYVNAAMLALLGKTLDEAVGKSFFELDYAPELAARLQRQIQEVIDTKQAIRDETPFTSVAGTRAYEHILVPVLGADGAVEAVVGSTRDITDRKRAEEQLRDADRKKDDFIALLAHELRNPLAPIRTGLQVLRMADDRTAREHARAMMDRQLTHMVRLIDDLLDISRINRSKMELRKEPIALADVVSSAVETARPFIDEAHHELTVSLPPRPIYLDADLTRLSQVFGNLLSNSAKYTPKGGRIWVSVERRGGEVSVSVRDTGIGIPERSLRDIFDMFSQVDRSIERSTGGLGIGLALVKGLVEMHGGRVTASSDGEGKGSTFTVTLPVLTDHDSSSADYGDGRTGVGPGRRILVVDDNRDGAVSLAMMLRLMGNEVRTANDGMEALAQAEAFRPDAILMDVGMPRLNGLDATRRIRAQDWGRDITIIALTGWGQDSDRERSRAAGCNGHLVKPVNLPDLERLFGEAQVGR